MDQSNDAPDASRYGCARSFYTWASIPADKQTAGICKGIQYWRKTNGKAYYSVAAEGRIVGC